MQEQAVFIEVGKEVVLEGVLSMPDQEAKGLALILHPHPLYGGSMHNNVVYSLKQAALEKGLETLCFNFRGVGRSSGVHDQGEGEVDDVLAAAKWLQVHSDKRQVWLAYSFGALMAAKAALNFSGLNGAFFVSPALALEPLAKWNNDNNKLTIISGDKDEYSQLEDLKAYCQAQSAPVNLVTLKGVDHFYVGNESALIRLTKDYLADLF